VLSFDLSAIPANATITSAKLSLWHPWWLYQGRTVEAHAVTAAWAEGADRFPSTCSTAGANWIDRIDPTVPWANPGGDFDPAIEDAVTDAASEEPSWDDWSLAPLVQRWVSGQTPNYGVLLKSTDETIFPNADPTWFFSDDFSAPSLRPRLTVTWATDT